MEIYNAFIFIQEIKICQLYFMSSLVPKNSKIINIIYVFVNTFIKGFSDVNSTLELIICHFDTL